MPPYLSFSIDINEVKPEKFGIFIKSDNLNLFCREIRRVILAPAGYEDQRTKLIPQLIKRVEVIGSWEEYKAIHGGPLLSEAMRREAEVLRAVGLAEHALGLKRAVLLTYPPRDIGHASGRGGLFNAAAYLAVNSGAVLVSLDSHFPYGTWDLHLRLGFPFVAIYSGPDGPHPSKLARHSSKALGIPLPPGAGDPTAAKLLKLLRRLADRPIVVELGFDFYYREPAGHFFFTQRAYYELGSFFREREQAYVVLDCLSEASLNALAAFIAGVEGRAPPKDAELREGEVVAREADRAFTRAFKALNKAIFRP